MKKFLRKHDLKKRRSCAKEKYLYETPTALYMGFDDMHSRFGDADVLFKQCHPTQKECKI
jgi:hypothetical protein